MLIELNTERKSLWFLLGRPDMNLNYVKPGPKELDWESLTPEQKFFVYRDLMGEILTTDGDIPVPPQIQNLQNQEVSASPFQEAISKAQEEAIDKVEKYNSELEQVAKKLLRKHAPTIKKALAVYKSSDIPLLRAALDLEESKKRPRGNVKKLLESAIVQLVKRDREEIDDTQAKMISGQGITMLEDEEDNGVIVFDPGNHQIRKEVSQ